MPAQQSGFGVGVGTGDKLGIFPGSRLMRKKKRQQQSKKACKKPLSLTSRYLWSLGAEDLLLRVQGIEEAM